MPGEKYISDVFDIDKTIQKYGKKIMLIAGVGSGKSTWVKEVLTKKGHVLFITSRRAKVDEDIENSTFSVFLKHSFDQQTLITNAKLAIILQNGHIDKEMTVDDFLQRFQYVVVDEVHSIASDSSFARSSFDVFSFINYAAESGVPVILMTGTPEGVESYYKKEGWHIIDYRQECKYVHPEKLSYTAKRLLARTIMKEWAAGKKVIYFVNHTDTIFEVMKDIKKVSAASLPKIAVLLAEQRRTDMDEKLEKEFGEYDRNMSQKTYESIVKKQRLPEDCQMLISTSRLKEGIDIKNENVSLICDNHILSNLIQYFGRVRTGGECVYIVEDSRDHPLNENELLYEYAIKKEIQAGNQYIEEYLKGDVIEEILRWELAQHVEKNPYIYYNYISGKFEVFHIKRHEEKRLKEITNWKKEIKKYCEKYGIKVVGFQSDFERKKTYKDLLENCWTISEFNSSQWEILRDGIRGAFHIKGKQISKINEGLERAGINVRFISKKGTSGKLRNQTYYKKVTAEEFNKLKK